MRLSCERRARRRKGPARPPATRRASQRQIPLKSRPDSFKRRLGSWRLLLKASLGRREELNDRNRSVLIREVAPHPVGKLQEVVTLELFHFLDCGADGPPSSLANQLEVRKGRKVAFADELGDGSPRSEPPKFVPVFDATGRDVKAVYFASRANAEGLREFGQARRCVVG